jgi:hypothetical protein
MMLIRENPRSKTFDCLCKGDVFISKGGHFMRVSPPDAKYNAVDLATGDMKLFNDTDSVLSVHNVKLTYDG